MEQELLEQAEQAMQKAREAGADDVVVQVQDAQKTEYVFRDGKLEQVQQDGSRGVSFRLYVAGRYSTHRTTDLRPDALSKFVADAVALTRLLEPDPHRVIPDPALFENRSEVALELDDPTVRDLPRDVCLEWLKGMDEASHKDERVVSATSEVSFGWRTSAQVGSNGFSGTQTGTRIGYGSVVTLKEGDHGRPEASRFVNGRHLEDLPDPGDIAAEALNRAVDRLGSEKGVSRRATMVVDPEAGGRLFGSLLGALSAQSVQQNRSFLADKQGEQIGSEVLTLIDDPLVRRGSGSRYFDGEGISAKVMPVIENGVLKQFYIDTYYGRKLDWRPTTGGVSNLVLIPGENDLDGLLKEAGEGFYITGWLGGNADSTSGDFSIGFRGHQIEAGEKGRPVSEMNITGNLTDLMGQLVAVGNDPNPWSSMRTPTLVFEGVEFSGR